MIRALIVKGKIRAIDGLPEHWRDGQEVVVEACEPADSPEEIEQWYRELQELSAQIPHDDHKRLAAALADQDREAKELMRQELGAR